MGNDDADDCGADGHDFVVTGVEVVERDGLLPGMAVTHHCRRCGAVAYEPSNVDRWPETGGLDPRLD